MAPRCRAHRVPRGRKTPQAVFDRVAPYYDALNSLLSFGMDRRWRREAVATLALLPGGLVLDVATGTGALAVGSRVRRLERCG